MKKLIVLILALISFGAMSQNRDNITWSLQKGPGPDHIIITNGDSMQVYMLKDSLLQTMLFRKNDSICIQYGNCIKIDESFPINVALNNFSQFDIDENNAELNIRSVDSSIIYSYEENSPEHIINATVPGSITDFYRNGSGVTIEDNDGNDYYVELGDLGGGSDDQVISISNDTIYLEDGGFAIIPPGTIPNLQQVTDVGYHTTNDIIIDDPGRFSIDSVSFIYDDGQEYYHTYGEYNGIHTQSGAPVRETRHRFGIWTIDVGAGGPEGDPVDWSSGSSLSINNFGDFTFNNDNVATQPWVNANDDVDDADSDPANELNNSFELILDTLRIEDAGGPLDVLLGPLFLDNDPTNEYQDLTLTGNDLGLTNSVPTVTLADVALDNDYNSLDNLPSLTNGLWQRPGSVLYPLSPTTSVAIGSPTGTADNRFHVWGKTKITAQAASQGWSFELESFDQGVNDWARMHVYNDGDFGIRTEGLIDAFVIENSQEIGIGTSSPNVKLHVYDLDDPVSIRAHSDQQSANIITQSAAGQRSRHIYTEGSNRWETGIDNTSNDKFFIGHGTNFANKYFTITNTGRVGIGNTDPGTKLHILDPSDARIRISETGSMSSYLDIRNVTANTAQILKYTNSGNSLLDISPIASDQTSNSAVRFFRNTGSDTSSGLVYIDIHQGNNTSGVNTRLSGNANSFLNAQSGNVGIGSTSATSKLQVTGDLKVTGTINNNSLDEFLVQDQNGLIHFREYSSLGFFDGVYTSLDFTGTTGLSDGVDDDTQDLSINGHILSLDNSPDVTLPTSNIITADMAFVRLSHNVAQDVSTVNTNVVLAWDTQQEHPFTSVYSHSTSTNNSRVEVLEDGNYLISGEIAFDAPSSVQRFSSKLKVRINGTTTLTNRFKGDYIRGNSPNTESGIDFAIIVPLEANDYFELLLDEESFQGGGIASISELESTLNVLLLKSATVTGSGSDNWGNQVVISDATITGTGTSGSPLGAVQQTLSWNAGTGELTLTNGGTVDISGNNTQLTQEQVQDFVGSMVAGNTETRISVTYDDTNNEFDFVVDPPDWNDITNMPSGFSDGVDNVDDNDNDPTNEIETWSTLAGIPAGFADGIDNVDDADSDITNELQDLAVASSTNGTISITNGNTIDITELSQDQIGPMLSGNTENGITVTYDDASNKIDFNVPSSADGNNYPTSLNVTGSGTKTITLGRNGLSNLTANFTDNNTQLSQEAVQDFVGSMVSGNTETGITVTYDDLGNEFDFVVAPSWSSITGMPSGFSDGIDDVNDADANPTNEFNTSVSFDGTNLSVVDGGGTKSANISALSDGNDYVNSLTVTGTTTKTITLGRTGSLPNLTANFTDLQGSGGDGYLQSVTHNSGILTFNVLNQSNPTLSLGGIGLSHFNNDAGFLTSEVDGSITNELQTLSVSNSTNGSITISSGNTIDITETVQDQIGPTVTGNVEDGISVTYDDGLGKFNYVVDDPNWNDMINIPAGFADGVDNVNDGDISSTNEIQTLSVASTTTGTISISSGNTIDITELAEDQVGAMVSGNTENGISVTYDDGIGKLNFDVSSVEDHDFYAIGGSAPPTSINEAIYTQNDLTVGSNSNPIGYRMNVVASDVTDVMMRLRQDNSTTDILQYFDANGNTDYVIGSAAGPETFHISSGSTIGTDNLFTLNPVGRLGINESTPLAVIHGSRKDGNTLYDLFIEQTVSTLNNTSRSRWLVESNVDNATLHNMSYRYISDDFPVFPSGTQTLEQEAASIEVQRPYDDSTHAEFVIRAGVLKTPTVGSPYGGYGGERLRFLKNGGLKLRDYVTGQSDVSLNVASRETHEQDIVGMLVIEDDGTVVRQHMNQAYSDAISSSATTYTLDEDDAYVFLTGSSPRTVNLPESSDLFQYKSVTIKCMTATQITLVPQGAALIENSGNSFVLSSSDPGVAVTVMMVNPGSWHVIGSYHAN